MWMWLSSCCWPRHAFLFRYDAVAHPTRLRQERGLGRVGQVKNQRGQDGGQQLAVDVCALVRAGILDGDGDERLDGVGALPALEGALDGGVSLLVVQAHLLVAGLGLAHLRRPADLVLVGAVLHAHCGHERAACADVGVQRHVLRVVAAHQGELGDVGDVCEHLRVARRVRGRLHGWVAALIACGRKDEPKLNSCVFFNIVDNECILLTIGQGKRGGQQGDGRQELHGGDWIGL